jgi:hypothetical protein
MKGDREEGGKVRVCVGCEEGGELHRSVWIHRNKEECME